MLLILSKYLPLFLYPLGLSLLLILAASSTLIWKRGLPAFLLVLIFLILFIPSTPAFSDYFLSSLEKRYPAREIGNYPKAGAIVVLSGGVSNIGPVQESTRPDENFDRLYQGWKLYKNDKAQYIIVSGGNIPWLVKKNLGSGAARMQSLLRQMGVPKARIIPETQSRNTRENALYTSRLLKKRGIHKVLLCTSALHLPRAMACFKKLGIDSVAVPAAFELTFYREKALLYYLPQARALCDSTAACKEYLGIFYYWMRGWV